MMIRNFLLAIVAMLVFSAVSFAAQTDSCEVWVQANVTYSVSIDTGSPYLTDKWAYNFKDSGANLALNTVYMSTKEDVAGDEPHQWGTWAGSATVYNSGNVSADWQLMVERMQKAQGQIWRLQSIGKGKDAVDLDTMTMCVMLTPQTSAPIDVSDDANWKSESMVDQGDDTGTNQWINLNSSFTTVATQCDSATAAKVQSKVEGGNSVPFSGSNAKARKMWIRIHTPNDTSINSVQKFRLNVRAQSGSTFDNE